MRVLLEGAWPRDADESDALERLVLRASDGDAHLILVTDAPAMEEWSGWLGLSRRQRELLRAAANAAAFSPPPSRGPHRFECRPAELGWQGALRLASSPVSVVVENAHTDGVLVRTALAAFADPRSRRLHDSPPATGPALQIDGAGGIHEVPKRLVALDVAAQGLPLRAVVVVDSDRRWPGAAAPGAEKAREAAERRRVRCIVLSKRSIENYIPDAVWDAWAAAAPSVASVVAALKRLPTAARDHFPVKRGFSKVDASDPQESAIYAAVSNHCRGSLAQGVQLHGDPKRPVISLLDAYADHATPEALIERDPDGDLRAMVDAIEAIL